MKTLEALNQAKVKYSLYEGGILWGTEADKIKGEEIIERMKGEK